VYSAITIAPETLYCCAGVVDVLYAKVATQRQRMENQNVLPNPVMMMMMMMMVLVLEVMTTPTV